MGYYHFNLLGAVREAASRLEGEFTYLEVVRLIKEEHPEFGDGDSYRVNNYLNLLVKQGRLVRVKATDRRAGTPGVYRHAGGGDKDAERQGGVTRDKHRPRAAGGLRHWQDEFDAGSLRRMLAEVAEAAKADPVYGVSREEAIRRAAVAVAEKYRRGAGDEEGGEK